MRQSSRTLVLRGSYLEPFVGISPGSSRHVHTLHCSGPFFWFRSLQFCSIFFVRGSLCHERGCNRLCAIRYPSANPVLVFLLPIQWSWYCRVPSMSFNLGEDVSCEWWILNRLVSFSFLLKCSTFALFHFCHNRIGGWVSSVFGHLTSVDSGHCSKEGNGAG